MTRLDIAKGVAMGDQKRWFKVWGSIVGDPHFGELPLEDVARWALLGAYVAVHGTTGRLTVPGDARELCHVLRVPSREAVIKAMERLPNVHVTQCRKRDGEGVEQHVNERGKNRDGEFTVTLSNWKRYQEDTTGKERMSALRAKKRREVTTTTTSTSRASHVTKSDPEAANLTQRGDTPAPPDPYDDPAATAAAREAITAVKTLLAHTMNPTPRPRPRAPKTTREGRRPVDTVPRGGEVEEI